MLLLALGQLHVLTKRAEVHLKLAKECAWRTQYTRSMQSINVRLKIR